MVVLCGYAVTSVNVAYAVPPPCYKTGGQYIGSGGGEDLTYSVTNNGIPVHDNDIITGDAALTMNFVASAYGECKQYWGTATSCTLLNTWQRTPSKISVDEDVQSSGTLNGTYVVGGVRWWSTATHVMDTADPNTTGPVSAYLYSASPGSYHYRMWSTIFITNCGMLPSEVHREMTVFERPNTDDQNLGCGNCAAGKPHAGNPVNASTGNKYETETDLAGPALPLTRHYNSKLFADFGFGIGWITSYHKRLEISASTIYARRGDGRADPFTKIGPVWAAPANITATLVQDVTGYTLTLQDRTVERYDLAGRLQTQTDRAGNTTSFTYDSATNRLSVVTDPYGRALGFVYGPSGRIAQVSDPAGHFINYTYVNSNLVTVAYQDGTARSYLYENTAFPHQLTGITDENGNRFATFAYDTSGRATSSEHAGGAGRYSFVYNAGGTTTVTDPMQTARTYQFQRVLSVNHVNAISGAPCDGCEAAALTYDANGNLAGKTDFRGTQTTYSFDATRNLELSRTEAYGTPQARTIATQYDPTYPFPSQVNEPGRVTTFAYDTAGNLLSKTVSANSLTRAWTYTYNTRGQVLTADGPRTDAADVTTSTYDTQGNLATVSDALGHVTRYPLYNAFGQPLRIEYPDGRVVLMSYDLRGRLTATSEAELTTTFSYTNAGDVEQITRPDGSFLHYSYDAARRLTGIADNLGNHIAYTLDAAGHRTAESTFDPQNTLTRTRSRVYNALGRLERDLDAEQNATVYGYDNGGNLTSITDPLNHSTSRGFDALNRLITITDAAQGLTQYGYDALDHLTSVQDPRGLTTSYAVDGLDNPNSTTSPDTGITNRTFDAAGNVATSTDARGVIGSFSYDPLNRMTSASYSDGTLASYQYDSGTTGIGHLTGMTDPGGSTSWQYDAHGRVALKQQTVSGVPLSMGYSYGPDGRLAQVTYPSGRIMVYGYDAAGRITQISVNGQTILSGVSYDPFGLPTSWTWGNGTGYSRGFDLNGRVTGFPLAGTAYSIGYDPDGRITSMAGGGGRTFGYDVLDRLTAYTGPGGNEGYSYDADGNRLTKTDGSTITYSYASTSNHLLTAGSASYSYDAAGATTSDSVHSFAYDGRGRLTSATASNLTTGYGINGLGQRISKSLAGVPLVVDRVFVYDEAGHLVGEYNVAGLPVRETLWLGDQPVATLDVSGAIAYVFADHLATPRSVTTTQNVEVWRWDLDPFGTGAANEDPDGDQVPFTYGLRFAGQYFDAETGLHQNWHRDYDPATDRYLQFDSIGLSGGLNGYVYAEANPGANIDPMGLAPRLGSEYRSCDAEDSATCKAQCGSRGVKKCDRLWYFKPVKVAQPGLTLYDWRKGPLACVCNDPENYCSRNPGTCAAAAAAIIGGIILFPEAAIPACIAANAAQ